MKPPETLAAFVGRLRREKNLSLTDVERESARHGEKIAGSYVSRIENGRNSNPSPEKLKALARGLGIPEEELSAVAFGRTPRSGSEAKESRLLAYFRELPEERQDDVIRVVRALHSGHSRKGRQRAA